MSDWNPIQSPIQPVIADPLGSLNPPGHMPGFHLPGTLIPIGAAVAAQQQAAQAGQLAAAVAEAEQRRREFLLLLS